MPRKPAGLRLSRAQVGWLAVGLALLGWMGLLAFTFALPPRDAALPGFFAIFFVAASASAALPLLWIHGRLGKKRPAPIWPPLRQGVEVGLWATLCVWLQWVRLLNWISAILFAVVLVLIEWFILTRK